MKNNFIISTIILIIGGFITKIMAMVIKIFLTRSVGEDGIGLYMLIMPTFNLFITLCSLSLPTAISKLISENIKSKKVIIPLVPIILIYNFILIILIIVLAPFISSNLLNQKEAYYPIISIGFTLPFIAISSILKGYYFGKERMLPYVIANILEQTVRLVLIILVIPKFMKFGMSFAISMVVLINIISEFTSTVCLIIFIPNKKIVISDFKYDKNIFKDILNISLNATGSRLIGSISYFFEPIILTFILLRTGYSASFIRSEYGIIMGYVFPLLLLPSFFTMAISTSLLPVISKNYAKGNYEYAKKKLEQAICLSLLIGVLSTVVFIIFAKELLHFIYNTSSGIKYIKILAPFFLIQYIQGPLTSFLQATGMANKAMMGTLTGAIIKNISLIILPIFMGMWGFVMASLINIFYVTIQHIYWVKRTFLSNNHVKYIE
jgi:stage V sporulation protein B